MSHIKYELGGRVRYTIDRENLKRCIINKCPHRSFGDCLKPKCILFRK